jgi:hypothetical protein
MSTEAGAEASTINVIGMDEQGDQDRWLFSRDSMEVTRAPVDTEKLRQNLTDFTAKLDHVLGAIPKALGELSLDSITVSVEISAKGSVSLLGVGGAEVAGTGGISFTLKRRPAEDKSTHALADPQATTPAPA